MLLNTKQDNKFVVILADGTLRLSVPEGTPGSVIREFENSKGVKTVKHELIYTELSGFISNIEFRDGDYGKSLQLTIKENGEDDITLSVLTSSNYGEDLLKKLLNIDMTKRVRLVPYAFEDDNGKTRKGVTVYQDADKVTSYFQEGTGKDTVNLHGYPDAPKAKAGKTISSEEWKLYYGQCRLFMIDYIEDKLSQPIDDKPLVEGKGMEDIGF